MDADGVKVEKVENTQALAQIKQQLIKQHVPNVESYDIQLFNFTLTKKGKPVTTSGNRTVRIALTSGVTEAKVFHVQSDGTLVDMQATVKEGYAEFTVDHFSHFALVQKKVQQQQKAIKVTDQGNKSNSTSQTNPSKNLASSTTPEKKSTLPQTGAISHSTALLSLTLSALGFLFSFRRRQ